MSRASFTRAGSTPSREKEVVSTRCAAAEDDALLAELGAHGLHGVVHGRVHGVVHHHLQHEVDAAAQVEAELDLARLVPHRVGRPEGHPAGDQERAVEDGAGAQLLAHERVGEAGQGGGEHEPEDEGVLRGREASTSSPYRGSAWRPATALFRTLILVFWSMRRAKASSSTATMVPKMPEDEDDLVAALQGLRPSPRASSASASWAGSARSRRWRR